MSNVETDLRGRVLVITLARESKRNAIDRSTADALDAALNRLGDDPEIWAGVLAARGPVFCAGSDLRADGDYSTERGGEYGIIRRVRAKPLVAAVDGPALGGGLEIVLSCDLVVASDSATFGLPEVTRGLIPTCAGLFRGPAALPLNVARELVLTGDSIDAQRAQAVGLVNLVVGAGQARDSAIALAQRICQNAPLAVQASLAAINRIEGASDAQGWSATADALDEISASADTREGILAFFEKRAPVWSGR